MPKPVEAPNPYVGSPAANIEDMTQPMGPLPEGDQAVVDAMRRLPARTGLGPDEYMARGEDGSITRVGRDGTFKQDIVAAHTMSPDGASESVTALVNPIPGVEAVSVSKTDSYAGSSPDSVHVSGNEVEAGHVRETDRVRAQAIKLEVANRIDEMREHLGEAGVEAAQR